MPHIGAPRDTDDEEGKGLLPDEPASPDDVSEADLEEMRKELEELAELDDEIGE
jgi:hypothetical protein